MSAGRYLKRGYLDARPLIRLITADLYEMPTWNDAWRLDVNRDGWGDDVGSIRRQILADRLGCTTRTLDRLKHQEKLQWQRCDVYAIRLGFHPVEIWGDAWLDAALA